MEHSNQMDRYLGQILDGRYEIQEVIGRGGMAVVYRAYCHLLNRNVAIKILRDDIAADSEFRQRFKQEAQAVAKLSHANIVSVYDVSRTPGLDYIVMELIEGVTLKQYMKTKGRISCKESAHFAAQICKALVHAHGKGIIHRDIKPQNIMIGMDGRIKVGDFGIAYLESELEEQQSATLGSVHYISPEQARGLGPDARSDIYSLGVVLYEMLSGMLPFTGDSPDEIAAQHVNGTPTPLRTVCADVPEELEQIVMRAMEQDITRRYQTAAEMLADLDSYLAESAEAAHAAKEHAEEVVMPKAVAPVSRSGELAKESYVRRSRRANKVSLLTGFLLVLVFAIAVFVFLWSYWLKDLFSDPTKISIPNFVGSDVEEITSNSELNRIYNFSVSYSINSDAEAGIIISQEPESGKSRTLDSGGIDITLTVSSGAQMVDVPNVVNLQYTEAYNTLLRSGFLVEYEFAVSDSVTADYVISTSPEAGDRIPAGATIYMTVSSGPENKEVQVPNVVGLSRAAAISKVEEAGLSLGNITYVESEMPEGTVIWQSITAYTTVEEHDKIYLQVSSGPAETAAPTQDEA
ncbi:MAG: Stk1 family PASTA domain-containing Ser/Thr kinase [Oscillospiraceae bacterium]|nr:Stk1 family PASTA domain-containing Ser/Thr kinase [Oscillospiraceae bacterium]